MALPCLVLLCLAGCGGNDEPSSAAAARIGDRVITEADVDRSVDALFPHDGGYSKAFGPPAYSACVRAKREAQGSSATAALRECKLEFGVLRAQTLSYLLRAEWARRETRRLHLADRGRGSLRERTDRRLDRLQAAISVSEGDILRYAKDNSTVYADSERRIVDVLQTRGRERALRARAELAAGRPWPQVVARHGTRPLRRTFNGRHEIRQASAPNDAFGRAMFSARIGTLTGPIRTLNGQFLFEVRQVSHAASDRLSATTRTTIRHALQSEQLADRLHARYAAETSCARRYRLPEVPQCM